MDLVLFGIQGSGKGTQAKKLAAEFDFDMFETGGELRAIAASDTDLGRTVKSFIDKGHLAPLEIVMQVVKEAILARPKDTRILFDGIPRNHEQMESFNEIMSDVGRQFRCIELTVDAEQALKRIQLRAAEQGREDDANEETIRRRMQLFIEKTKPVIDAYKAQDIMTEVDGEGSVDEVYERMKAAVQAM